MYDDFTHFANFSIQSQAYLVKSFLEGKGIRVILNVSNMPLSFPGMNIGQHDLYVLKEDFEKATMLYEDYLAQEVNDFKQEYTDEEFEELAVNSKFEDLDTINIENTRGFADPKQNDENYQEYNLDDKGETPDDPYYQRGVGLTMSSDLINAKVDDAYNEDEIYKCPNCENVYLVKEKMQGGLKALFVFNYIFIFIIIVSFIAGTGAEEGFAKNMVKILPVNVLIMIAHIVILTKSKFRCEECGHVEKH